MEEIITGLLQVAVLQPGFGTGCICSHKKMNPSPPKAEAKDNFACCWFSCPTGKIVLNRKIFT